MIDLQTAVQVALFTALNGAAGVTDIADVWQNVPEDTQPVDKGLVIIGPVSLDGSATKDGGLEKAKVPIFTEVRRPDITELYALNSAVRDAIDDQFIEAPGAELGRPIFLSAAPGLMDDGVTYFDMLLFEMFVQAA